MNLYEDEDNYSMEDYLGESMNYANNIEISDKNFENSQMDVIKSPKQLNKRQ